MTTQYDVISHLYMYGLANEQLLFIQFSFQFKMGRDPFYCLDRGKRERIDEVGTGGGDLGKQFNTPVDKIDPFSNRTIQATPRQLTRKKKHLSLVPQKAL